MCSLADLAGPQRWGILPTVPTSLRKAAHSTLDDVMQPASLDIWLPLLQDTSLYPLICTTIAQSIRTFTHRILLCEWLPPAERAKANKGKRGWEKRAASITSPATPASTIVPAQSWLLRELLRAVAVQGNTSKIAVSLEALATLCKDNPVACAFIKSDSSAPLSPTVTPTSEGGYVQSLLLLQRSSSADVRIATNEL